jgi:hypothetical protein
VQREKRPAGNSRRNDWCKKLLASRRFFTCFLHCARDTRLISFAARFFT